MKLYYVMDPMCSWCWAFRPSLSAALKNYPTIETYWIMGGLAPDSDQPMPAEMQESIKGIWQSIEERTDASFNYDFWTEQSPRRSTYIACRAILAAHFMQENEGVFPTGGAHGKPPLLVEEIQQAYYQNAQNPSDAETLIKIAENAGLDRETFTELLNSEETQSVLDHHLQLREQWGISGFPSIVVEADGTLYPLTQGYLNIRKTIELIDAAYKQFA